MATNVCVFLGPTLPLRQARKLLRATFFGPATQGDVLRVVQRRPAVIAVIDGAFHFVPSIWHKEILAALEQGILVYGGASIGALRAAELAHYGMIGVGEIYERFHSGKWEDDDEVAVTFAPKEQQYRPLSLAMVDIRDICEAAASARAIEYQSASGIVSVAKDLYFPQRIWPTIEQSALKAGITEAAITSLREFRRAYGPTLKQRDTLRMLSEIARLAPFKHQPQNSTLRVRPTIFFQRLQDDVTRDPMDDIESPPGSAFDVARKKVLLGVLATREGIRTGFSPDDNEISVMSSWFRDQYQLSDDRQFFEWLAKSSLKQNAFDLGIRRFASVVKIERLSRIQLRSETEDYMRLYGAASRHQLDGPQWTQINLILNRQRRDPASQARLLFGALSRLYPSLKRSGLIGLYFMRKEPDVRIRFQSKRSPENLARTIAQALKRLAARRIIDYYSSSPYEPEDRLFGGQGAMSAVHQYFFADSLNWIKWELSSRSQRKISTQQFACSILNDLFIETVGDRTEIWDVWQNLFELTRRSPGPVAVFEVSPKCISQLAPESSFTERHILGFYRRANLRLAKTLKVLHGAGELSIGLRSVLPFIAMFLCNRYGIAGEGQAAIARAMIAAWDPKIGFR
jgi:thiopeptide-type bacteriocin biosynthesis protein